MFSIKSIYDTSPDIFYYFGYRYKGLDIESAKSQVILKDKEKVWFVSGKELTCVLKDSTDYFKAQGCKDYKELMKKFGKSEGKVFKAIMRCWMYSRAYLYLTKLFIKNI